MQITYEADTSNMTVMLHEIAEQVRAGELDQALQRIEGIEENDENRVDLLYLRGYIHETKHEWNKAMELYERAVELEPDHIESSFRLALLCDLHGDDERAMELYDHCTRFAPVYINALLNKAVLLEEQGDLDDAERCVQQVLKEHPDHERARRIESSIDASYNMIFDERTQKERDARNAVLDLPVSDFELSVRSRNCLKQMNIRTLGDLLRTTEEELLAYKNFGETSLNEIKAMLSQKGLRLGQSTIDSQFPEPQVAASGPVPLDSDQAILLGKPVSELELSVRSRKCLQRLGIGTLGELTMRSETELMSIKNFGQTSLNEIKRQLSNFGLTLRGGH